MLRNITLQSPQRSEDELGATWSANSNNVRNDGGMSGWLCLSCIEEVNSNASYEECKET